MQVVVESPAKAKVVGRYLGRGYRVFTCYGHVSDLPAKAGSVRPDEDSAMTCETAGKCAALRLGSSGARADAEGLILMTDTDREPETGAARKMGTSVDRPPPGMGRAKEPERAREPKSADRDLGL